MATFDERLDALEADVAELQGQLAANGVLIRRLITVVDKRAPRSKPAGARRPRRPPPAP